MSTDRIYKTLGTVAMSIKDKYNSEVSYDKLNLVTHKDVTYLASEPVKGENPETSSKWKPIGNLGSVLKFHAVAGSSATYIAEFTNGKKLLVDTGMPEQWNTIKTAIDNLGIEKFDYFIITHFHYDHKGNIQNFIDNYDFTECICWVQMKPDFENHSEDIEESESDYNNVINLLRDNELNPIVPENNSYFTIDENTKLHFLNTDSTIAENYYGAITEYREQYGVNFNQFSLICEIMYKNDVITLCGDIERVTEKYMYPFVHKTSLLVLAHHGINRDYYNQFYYATLPDYAFASWIGDTDTWIRLDSKQFNFVKDLNCKIVTNHSSQDINGLFTFISDGQGLKTTSYSTGYNDSLPEKPRLYSNFLQLINTTDKLRTEYTLDDIFNNMNQGDIFLTQWFDSYNTDYSTIYSELQTIFPEISNMLSNLVVEFKKSTGAFKQITIYNDKLTFIAKSYSSTTNWKLESGQGLFNTNIVGITDLITKIKSLPIGHYVVKNYKDDIGSVLVTDGNYQLNIDICERWYVNSDWIVIGSIYATLKTTTTRTDKPRVVGGFFNTSADPQYVWYKLNNVEV